MTTTPPTVAELDDWEARWLRGVPCRAPCWEGITPGQTSAAEAVEILRTLPNVNNAEVVHSLLLPSIATVEWQVEGIATKGLAYFEPRHPGQPILAISPNFASAFRLDDVIQAYGEPSHLIAVSDYILYEEQPTEPQGIWYDLQIIYLTHGLLMAAVPDGKPNLTLDLLLLGPDFFVPTQEGLARASVHAAHPERMMRWRGFQRFDDYCRNQDGGACPNPPQ